MAPATVLIRARRALHTDGRTVAPGDVARMPVESALAGIACGQLEIIGPEAVGVIVRPSASWTTPRADAARPVPSEWMLSPADRNSVAAGPLASAARGYRAARPTATALAIFAADGEGWP